MEKCLLKCSLTEETASHHCEGRLKADAGEIVILFLFSLHRTPLGIHTAQTQLLEMTLKQPKKLTEVKPNCGLKLDCY